MSEASIIDVKVIGDEGFGYTSDLIKAIDWVIQNRDKYDIRVANFSLGHPPIESYRDDPLCHAIRRLVGSGIVAVVSAGNLGKTPKHGKIWGGITSPGTEPSAITVGSRQQPGHSHPRRRRRDHLLVAWTDREIQKSIEPFWTLELVPRANCTKNPAVCEQVWAGGAVAFANSAVYSGLYSAGKPVLWGSGQNWTDLLSWSKKDDNWADDLFAESSPVWAGQTLSGSGVFWTDDVFGSDGVFWADGVFWVDSVISGDGIFWTDAVIGWTEYFGPTGCSGPTPWGRITSPATTEALGLRRLNTDRIAALRRKVDFCRVAIKHG